MRRVTTLCGLYAAFAMPIAMLGVAWPEIRETLLRSDADLGVLAGCYGVGRLSTATSSGVLLRVTTFGPAVLATALILAASCLVVAAGSRWPVLVATIIVVGLATGALESLGTRFLAVTGSVRAAGLAAGSYGIGSTVGPALVSLTGDWRAIYVVAALVTAAAGAAVAAPGVRWPTGPAWQLPAATAGVDALRSRRPERTAVTVSLLLFFVFVGIDATAGQWTATFLEQARGVDRWLAGLAVSGFFAGATTGRLLLGVIDIPVRALPLLAGLVVPLLAGIAVGPPRLAPLFVSLAGVTLAPVFPVLMATTGRRLGALHAGQVSGWQLIAGSLGATALPAFTGLAVAWVGPDGLIFVLLTAGVTGAALLTLVVGDWVGVPGVTVRRRFRLGG